MVNLVKMPIKKKETEPNLPTKMKPYETTISKATSDFEIQKEAKERQGRSTKHDLISGMAIK